MNIHKIADHLNSLADNSETGMVFDCQPISGENCYTVNQR